MKKFVGKLSGVLMITVVFMLLMAAVAGASDWKAKYIRFSGIAGETVAVGDAVAILPTTGRIWKADANTSTLRPAVGVIGKGGAAGATVEVVVMGIITGMTAKSPGTRLFLDETSPGVMVTTAPTNAQALGWVMPGTDNTATSTTYFIDIKMPESTGAAY